MIRPARAAGAAVAGPGRRARGLALLLLVLLGTGLAAHVPEQVEEYELKALFLQRMTAFIEWPEGRIEEKKPFVVGVYRTDPFGEALDRAMRDRKVGGAPVVVRRFRNLEELPASHLLFVPREESARIRQVAEAVRDRGVLVVSEGPGLALRGAVINFFLEDQKLRFEVNPAQARRERIAISSDLLKLARIVEEEEEEGS